MTKTTTTKPVLSFADYVRMHSVITALLDGVDADTNKACLIYAVVGAFLIETYHKREAIPCAGVATYRLNSSTEFTMIYGAINEGKLVSSDTAFHCWIECDGMAIDLMAPLFPDMTKAEGRPDAVARKMFQRPLAQMSGTPFAHQTDGDFYLEKDAALTNEMLQAFQKMPENTDLANLGNKWYRPTPKHIDRIMRFGDDKGSSYEASLKQPAITGVWGK